MRQLTVRLFGVLELGGAGRAPITFPTRRAKSLFAFLALNRGRFFSREALVGTFWPEWSETSARKGLRSALWRVRQVLLASGLDADDLVQTPPGLVGIPGKGGLWVDTHEFEARTRIFTEPGRPELDADGAESLHRATRLYRGSLLEGLYDDWCCQERERLRLTFLAALERLAGYHERKGEWQQAIERASHLLRHDPLREHVHRQLMRCHYAMGNRPAALRQYRLCEEILEDELGVQPMAETRLLLEWIAEGKPLVVRPNPGNGGLLRAEPEPLGRRDPLRSWLVRGGQGVQDHAG